MAETIVIFANDTSAVCFAHVIESLMIATYCLLCKPENGIESHKSKIQLLIFNKICTLSS
jgi:hypothetical protein